MFDRNPKSIMGQILSTNIDSPKQKHSTPVFEIIEID